MPTKTTSATTTSATKTTSATTTKRVAKPKTISKTCRVCGISKTLDEYRAKASRPDGRDTICALCARAWLANRKREIEALANAKTTKRATTKTTTTTKPKTTTTTKRASAPK